MLHALALKKMSETCSTPRNSGSWPEVSQVRFHHAGAAGRCCLELHINNVSGSTTVANADPACTPRGVTDTLQLSDHRYPGEGCPTVHRMICHRRHLLLWSRGQGPGFSGCGSDGVGSHRMCIMMTKALDQLAAPQLPRSPAQRTPDHGRCRPSSPPAAAATTNDSRDGQCMVKAGSSHSPLSGFLNLVAGLLNQAVTVATCKHKNISITDCSYRWIYFGLLHITPVVHLTFRLHLNSPLMGAAHTVPASPAKPCKSCIAA